MESNPTSPTGECCQWMWNANRTSEPTATYGATYVKTALLLMQNVNKSDNFSSGYIIYKIIYQIDIISYQIGLNRPTPSFIPHVFHHQSICININSLLPKIIHVMFSRIPTCLFIQVHIFILFYVCSLPPTCITLSVYLSDCDRYVKQQLHCRPGGHKVDRKVHR